MPTYSGSTVTVDSGSQNIDISISQGNAIIVSLEAASFAGTVDFKSTIDGVTYTNHPYVEYHAASPSKSVAQITNPTTYAAYVIFPPVIQARIVVAYSSGSLEVVWREIGYKAGLDTGLGALSSAELKTAISDETGSGAAVFATDPVLVAPRLGTPHSAVMTNATGTAANFTAGTVTTNADLTGMVTSDGNAATVVTNANLTGHVTSSGNAASLGSFTKANLSTAVSDGTPLYSGDITIYTDAEAIAAVEGEATLALAGDVSVAADKAISLANEGKVKFTDTTFGDGNQRSSGITLRFTTSSLAIAIGQAVHLSGTTVILADADVGSQAAMPCIGVAASATTGSGTENIDVLVLGCMRYDTYDFTAGSDVYVTATAGGLDETAPSSTGHYVQKVGIAISADILYVNPSLDVIEHA